MAGNKARGRSLAPLSKKAGADKRQQIKEMKAAALKSNGDGKVKVK